ncbi:MULTISPECIES: hypothetical protein [Rhizobium]|uniref:hypothetical protein n=1 Tax=Rhizobium TaxID=379 RepID=UPI001030B7AB|nr:MULTISPECIES: hypothetical protein [Rhizobium]NZD51885.1 hypothetical protein [Rhizobium leguminosarum]TBB71763.1 hypothetical protein ELH45_14950 [Rhizobium ruizarguesonis]
MQQKHIRAQFGLERRMQSKDDLSKSSEEPYFVMFIANPNFLFTLAYGSASIKKCRLTTFG